MYCRQGGVVPDRFLKVYDVRMLRALSPVPVVGEPFLLRFLPSFSSQLAIISAMGQLQVLDAASASAALQLLQVHTEGAMCMALEVSSSCQYLAVGDAGGYLHTFTSNPIAPFITFSRPTDFADPIEMNQPIALNELSTPLSSIPMPFPNGPLLSDWPDQFTRRKFRYEHFLDKSEFAMSYTCNEQESTNSGPCHSGQYENGGNYRLRAKSSRPPAQSSSIR